MSIFEIDSTKIVSWNRLQYLKIDILEQGLSISITISSHCHSEGWADWAAAQGADEGGRKNGLRGRGKGPDNLFLLVQFQDEQKFKFLNVCPGRKNSWLSALFHPSSNRPFIVSI
jgi:hypothetical protein